MLAVLGAAIASTDKASRDLFMKDISIATTAWLAGEKIHPFQKKSSFLRLLSRVENHFDEPGWDMNKRMPVATASFQ